MGELQKMEDQELKAKWLEALRSGKYLQGVMTLRRYNESMPDSFCCLGVLADVAGVNWEPAQYGPYMRYGFKSDGEEGLWVTDLPGTLLHPTTTGMCMHMNDSENKSFNEIADWIEENL